ncbi:MAG TPA: TraR/DksA family transcriptional regulator [Bdellovibrionales bacterium]|nr:TraR/DksA family transcriptional regulator [Bdellovibrionales bacterium]
MARLTEKVVKECKRKLLETKMELLNRIRNSRDRLSQGNDEVGGDEADQTSRLLQESEFISNQERIRAQLLEIELALSRIENGAYGVCEETEEPIEVERLMAIPWTRLSIEGAELREAMKKKYAR